MNADIELWSGVMRRDATRRDATRRDATRRDATRRDATRCDAARRDAMRRGVARHDAMQRGAARRGAARRDAMRFPQTKGKLANGLTWDSQSCGSVVRELGLSECFAGAQRASVEAHCGAKGYVNVQSLRSALRSWTRVAPALRFFRVAERRKACMGTRAATVLSSSKTVSQSLYPVGSSNVALRRWLFERQVTLRAMAFSYGV